MKIILQDKEFADLEKQEQECKTCLFYLLQED